MAAGGSMTREGYKRFLNLRYFLLTVVWFVVWMTLADRIVGRYPGWVRFGFYFVVAAVWPAVYIYFIEPRLRGSRGQS